MNAKPLDHSSQQASLGILLASLLCIPLAMQATDPVSYADDFESPTLNSFWTAYQQNGTVVVPSTAAAHTGNASALLQTSGGGQKELSLRHAFETLQYGKVTVWVHDTQEYIYFGLLLQNMGVDTCAAGVSVQDWDHSAYYYGLGDCTGGKSSVARTVGWHKFEVNSTASTLTLSVDDQPIYSGPGGRPFNLIRLNLSGPGGGGIAYDDFSFEAAPEPAAIQITSLNGNGQMTWTNLAGFSNGLFSVEWAARPGTNWHGAWNGLEAFRGTGTATTVEVPMLYRVKAVTNLFIPWIPGAELHFTVTNAVGSNWTEQIKVLGLVKPSAGGGKKYALVENTERGQMKTHLLRSTDSALFRLDGKTLADDLEFMIAPVGTAWTNYNYEGQITLKVAVEAIETVTVPAGTFPNCYKFHKTALNAAPGETAEWYEWICPGFGMVKWLDYWVEPSENPPVVHDLESWSATAL